MRGLARNHQQYYDFLHNADTFRQGDFDGRGEFKTMTGMPERSSECLLKAMLDYKLLPSDTPKGKLYMGVPLQSLQFLFPNLWPEAEQKIAKSKVI
jgi:hypothetical protein